MGVEIVCNKPIAERTGADYDALETWAKMEKKAGS